MKNFLFLTALIFLFLKSYSQTDPYPYRGLYVDKFVRYNSFASNIDEAKTLLGRAIEEDSLLNFARDNDFKYLILYDISRVFNKGDSILPGSGGRTYKQALCDFIIKAKSQFCIEHIGVAISSTSVLDSIDNFNSLVVSDPYIFNTPPSQFRPSAPNPISFVENTYTAADGEIALRSELVKTILRLNDFNSFCSAKINVVTTEYEFWQQFSYAGCLISDEVDYPNINSITYRGTTYTSPATIKFDNNITVTLPADSIIMGRDTIYPPDTFNICRTNAQFWSYRQFLINVKSVQDSATYPFLIDTYLGWFSNDSINDLFQSDVIDSIVDRIGIHTYNASPGPLWGIFDNRDSLFGHNNTLNTIVHPILSSEQTLYGGEPWLGIWLANQAAGNTLFEAEKTFMSGYFPNASVWHGDNIPLQYGAFNWFAGSFFKDKVISGNRYYLPNKLFQRPANACSGQSLNFNYIGPNEPGITFVWDFADGTKDSIYNPAVSSQDTNHIFHNSGTYIVKCTLYYPAPIDTGISGCVPYTYQDTVVINGASITAGGPTTFCQGDSVHLTASGGSAWSWTGGATTQSIWAKTSGTYSVTVTGSSPCTTSTASIAVIVNAHPTVSITPANQSICSGDTAKFKATGATTYSWSGTTGCSTCDSTTAHPTSTTAYTVTGTTNGCTGTATTTITVNFLPTVAITSLNSSSFCSGGKDTLSATAGLTSYKWYNSSGAIVGATSSKYIATTSGTYYCIGTNSNGCHGTSGTITVTVWPTPTISVTDTNVTCFGGTNGSIVISGATGTAPFVYYANGNLTGTHTSTTSSTSHTFSSLSIDTFDVYIIDNNGCSSTHHSVIITSSTTNCCIFSQTLPSSGSHSSQNYNLSSSLTLSGNLKLHNCQVDIAANVSITVPSGDTLLLDSSTVLFACGNMWTGIVIQIGGVVKTDNATIKDAKTAISADGGGAFRVRNSTFDNNYIGIYMANADFSTSFIKGTTFDCSSGTILKSPYAGNISLYHIELNHVDPIFQIGDQSSSANRNYFSNATNGIFSSNSTIKVYNCSFEAGPNNGPLYAYSMGIYIRGNYNDDRGNTNIIGELSSYGDNFFNNYYHGLESDNNYGTIAENNSFQECLVGIHYFNVDDSKASENYISNYTLSPQLYQEMKIGIDVEGTGTELGAIDNNYVLNYTTGIHARNIPKVSIGKSNNIFIMTPNDSVLYYNLTLRGIHLENCPNATVSLNDIYRFEDPDSSIQPWIRGIDIDASQSAAIYANNLRKTGAGIQLFSVCTGTQLLCNVMLDCYNGVFLSSCTYSDQGASTAAADNYWNNQIDPTWFRVDGNANTVKWFYDATVDTNYNPNPHPPLLITDVDNTPHSDCPDPTIVQLDPGDALRSIANGSIDYEDFQSEMTYSDQQYFYEKLREDSVLMYSGEPTDSLFQALYNQLRSGNIGLFSGVKDMIRNYDFAQAYIRNQLIVDSNLMETNKKAVIEIFLYCKIHDTIPNSSQVATLTSIAYQYPPAGGEAVYLARAILGLHIEDNLPLLRKGRTVVQAKNSNRSFGRIYPNPATNNFVYQFESPLATTSNITFELTDARGKAVLKVSLKCNLRIPVNAEKLMQGVYYYRVLINNVVKDRGKVVIIK